MSTYFYALVQAPYDDYDISFEKGDDGFDYLASYLDDSELLVVYFKDVSNHGVFVRPRDINFPKTSKIGTTYFAGDAGCFVTPKELKTLCAQDPGFNKDHNYKTYVFDKLDEYDAKNALMFIL